MPDRSLARPDVRPALKPVGVALGVIGAFIALFPVTDLSLSIRLLLFALSLLAVGNGSVGGRESAVRDRDETLRWVSATFQVVLGVALGLVAVLPKSEATMSLRVPALFTALVLVGRIAAPSPRRRAVDVDLVALEAGEDVLLGRDGTPEDQLPPVEAAAKSYEQVGPVVADRNRLAVPALAVVLAMWLGLGLLSQPRVSPLGGLAWVAMFRLFWIGWQRLTGEPGPSVEVPAGAVVERVRTSA